MEQQVEQKNRRNNEAKKKSKANKRNVLTRCCCYPYRRASCMVRGIGRCVFITCYPVVQCLGFDEHRHRHHMKHFDW